MKTRIKKGFWLVMIEIRLSEWKSSCVGKYFENVLKIRYFGL